VLTRAPLAAAPRPVPPLLDQLEPSETIIDEYYMEQLLAHGMALGRGEVAMHSEGAQAEAKVRAPARSPWLR
jgi:hypothetical protein